MTKRRYEYASSSALPFPSSSSSQRQSTVFSINGSSVNHANLRRHLQPHEQQDPPPLVRQGAFMVDDTSDPFCRICYGATEDMEYGHFIRPCKCRGSMYVEQQQPDEDNNLPFVLRSGNVHEKCLRSWLSSVGTARQCSTCLYEYTLPESSSSPPPPPTQFALPALSLSSSAKDPLSFPESARCIELRKVPGAEIDDSPDAPLGRPDYIWLPSSLEALV
ncbi:hypothetical protein BJV82DRAFT_574784 [Fennellomyces sp. T-0311]|nr:hypothetical protein BJV82DRAFT_574784 [Fennellomyces sp. T-0311]